MDLLKISDLAINSSVTITLLVKSAEKRLTKTKKPFLVLTLTDGTEDIVGNNWDYFAEEVPAANTVLELKGRVSEYNGKKQLTVNSFNTIDDADISRFMPNGNVNVNSYAEIAIALINEIKHEPLKKLLFAIFDDYSGAWSLAPSAVSVHHAYIAGNLQHSVDTALKAKALAMLIPNCNVDLCVAGALIHDIGKLRAYGFNQAVIEMTGPGKLFEHIVLGIEMLNPYITPENSSVAHLLKHIIASHHGKQEFGSPATPKFLEAYIVSCADDMDAKVHILLEASNKKLPDEIYTDKVWLFDNHEMYTQQHIAKLLSL